MEQSDVLQGSEKQAWNDYNDYIITVIISEWPSSLCQSDKLKSSSESISQAIMRCI